MPMDVLKLESVAVGSATGVNPSASTYPDEKIVAMVHSHTPIPNTNVAIPSYAGSHADGGPGDIADMARMMAQGTIDPGALYYIVDAGTKTTYEYTWTGPEIRVIGSDITHDTVPCA